MKFGFGGSFSNHGASIIGLVDTLPAGGSRTGSAHISAGTETRMISTELIRMYYHIISFIYILHIVRVQNLIFKTIILES